jgi:hypothetical protein
MLLSSGTTLGEFGCDFQRGFTTTEKDPLFARAVLLGNAQFGRRAKKRRPSLAGAWNLLPLYSGAGVALGFLTSFFFGVGVAGAGGTPGTA